METMILVAGLAVAGLVGIAAAFYFSIRAGGSDNKRKSRVRAARSGLASGTMNARRSPNSGRSAFTDPGDAGDPGLVGGPPPATAARRTRAEAQQARQAQREVATMAMPAYGAGSATEVSLDDTPGEVRPDPGPDDSAGPLGGFGPAAPRPGGRSATRLARAGGAGADEDAAQVDEDTARADRPRRRMGWRKGADIDEEMWPTESFGGVSDDQFWDDLASDKPLARTARPAQQGSAKRSLATDPSSVQPPRPGPKSGGAWGNARRTGNSAYPESPPGAADRTAIQPVHAAPQPGPASPASGATQPVQTQPVQTQPVPARPTPARPTPARQAPSGPRHVDAGISANEDPLTSSAFSLRSSGPVDGRSNQAPSGPHDISREHNPAGGNRATEDRARPDRSQPSGGWYRSSDTAAIETYGRPADAQRRTAAYPYPGQPLSAPVVEAPGTPPNGVPYGYGNASNVRAPADEPRRPNVTGRPNATGEHIRRGRSGYPAPRQGQGEGHPSGGQRRPRDPRDDYQRLVSKRLPPLAH
jgi:hypothetical protein